MKKRNYNQGRVKELIENALNEVSENEQTPETGQKHNYSKFDELPENHISDDSKSLLIKCYNTETGDVLAFCSIRERYLDLIHDGNLSNREHEYNLFRKYVEIFSIKENKPITICKTELTCPEDCTCKCCVSSESIDDSENYTINDVFRDGFEGDIDSWNHANQ